ncbi:ABC transporter permease subunit [Cellulomonas sp. ATA003]|uniref:ABC transporter permease subunit n=1 Tax=Cellulomonas sp. ATA003 TaxID=3073064 RepID=UPI00287307A0|nr:branched-chain amino acid ABC transporter permease [Cellulomonas sp. ATA003]WNB87013.1 branched-chain amino acid ABC transporter permease [Cellulomonas sp. ATA003]
MDRSPTTRAACSRLLALLVGALALLGTLLGPAGTARAAVAECVPDASTGCVTGTLRTAAGDPAVGVTLTVEGPGGEVTATSGPDGRWSAPVDEAGEYTVTLDPSTLPAGETLRDPAGNPRTVTAQLGAAVGALFPLGAPTAPPATEGDAPAPDPGDESVDAGTGGEPGVDTVPTGTTSGGGITWDRVAQQALAGIVFGTLLALASIGLSLIFGTTGLSNFAHGEQVTIGGVVAYLGVQTLGLPLVAAGALAVVVAGASGWLQDKFMWHPLRKRRVGMTQQLIVTIGLAIALQYTFQFFFGASSLRIVTATPQSIRFGGVFITQQSLISVIIAAVVLAGVAYFLVATRTGRATRAVSDNPALAAASGISVERIIRIVWTFGAALAGLGGVLMGLYLNATAWNMGGTLLLLMFAAVTLGGLGTAFGALVGSLVIGLVVEMSNLVIPSDMRYAGALVILILILLFRPQGILGRAERIG